MGQEEPLMPDVAADTQMAQLLMRSHRWMANLAHELRTPLSAIIMSLEELRDVCATEPSAIVIRDIAQDGAAYMARVIDDALELCRAQTGKLRFQTERVDLSRIVMDAIRNAQPVLSQKDHQVTLTLPCGRIIVEAHPTRMEQILTNLLINAAKYTSPGGEICVGVERTANTVVLRVCDNGIGIAPEYLSRVFEPYWQGTASDGLGLGLALVKSLVELHDGTVVAHSDGPGKGSEFVVRLPAFRSCPNQPAIDMLRATVV